MICATEQELGVLLGMMVAVLLAMGIHVLVQDPVHVLLITGLVLEPGRHQGHTLLLQDVKVITLLPRGGIQIVRGPQGITQKDVKMTIRAGHILQDTVGIMKTELPMVTQEKISMMMTGDGRTCDRHDAPQLHLPVLDPDLQTTCRHMADREHGFSLCTLPTL